MKNGKYLICPSSEQSVLVYRRDSIDTYVDRILEQPGSVESIVKFLLFRLKLMRILFLLVVRMALLEHITSNPINC